MLIKEKQPPENTKLGKAKALESMIIAGGIRIFKKAKVRFWCERRGAREDYYILFREKTHHLTSLEFKRRFKVILKGDILILPALQKDDLF